MKRSAVLALGGVLLATALVSVEACGNEPERPRTIATFEVAGGETFKVELATADLIDHANRLLAGETVPSIPLGTVVRDDPDVNDPWSWHIDPKTLEFADFAIELCDGLPSYIERGTLTSDQFCPWTARVIRVEQE